MSRFLYTMLQVDLAQLEALESVLEAEWGSERDVLQPVLNRVQHEIRGAREMNERADAQIEAAEARGADPLEQLWNL